MIILLGIAIFVQLYPGQESFEAGDLITNQDLYDAGILRPSVFNCASTIGVAAEQTPTYAGKNDM